MAVCNCDERENPTVYSKLRNIQLFPTSKKATFGALKEYVLSVADTYASEKRI